MFVKAAGIVDKGNVREKNDDRLLIAKTICREGNIEVISDIPFVAVVCDGVGSDPFGGAGAEFATLQLAQSNYNQLSDAGFLQETLRKINESIVKKGQAGAMRTTISGILVFDNRVITINAGDSRVYRYRDGVLKKMTTDNSETQELLDSGVVPMNEKTFVRSAAITKCLGSDLLSKPDINVIEMRPFVNDEYLVCSDGMWSFLTTEDIEEIMRKDMSPYQKTKNLFDTAIQNMSDDNISVCVMKIMSEN